MAALSTYELSRLDNMAQNRRKLTCLGLVREPAAHKKQARRRAAAPEAATRASVRRTEAPPRRYDTLHLFGRDVAEWPLPGVQRSHTLLVVRLVVRGLAVARGHAGQARARPSRLAAAAGAATGAAAGAAACTTGAAAGAAGGAAAGAAGGAAGGTAAGATAPRSQRPHHAEAVPLHDDVPAAGAEGPAGRGPSHRPAQRLAPRAIGSVVWL